MSLPVFRFLSNPIGGRIAPIPPLDIPGVPLKPLRISDLGVEHTTHENDLTIVSTSTDKGLSQTLEITDCYGGEMLSLHVHTFDAGFPAMGAISIGERHVALDANARKALRVMLALVDGEQV